MILTVVMSFSCVVSWFDMSIPLKEAASSEPIDHKRYEPIIGQSGRLFPETGAMRRNLDIFAGTAFFWLKSRFIVKESYPNNENKTIVRKQPPQTNNQMISLEGPLSAFPNFPTHFVKVWGTWHWNGGTIE